MSLVAPILLPLYKNILHTLLISGDNLNVGFMKVYWKRREGAAKRAHFSPSLAVLLTRLRVLISVETSRLHTTKPGSKIQLFYSLRRQE